MKRAASALVALLATTSCSVSASEIAIHCEAKDGSYLAFTTPLGMPSAWAPVRETIRASLSRTPDGNYEGTATTDLWQALAELQLPATWTPSMGHPMIYEPNWGGGKRPFKLIGIDISNAAGQFRAAAEVSTSRDTAEGVLITRYVCAVQCTPAPGSASKRI